MGNKECPESCAATKDVNRKITLIAKYITPIIWVKSFLFTDY